MTPELWRKCAKKAISKSNTQSPAQNTATKPAIAEEKPIEQFKELELQKGDNGFKVEFDMRDFQDAKSPFNKNNKYGYQINVNHKAIYPVYIAYKRYIKEPYVLSDSQRADFEKLVIAELYEIGITK